MKPSLRSHAVWAAASACTFAMGYWAATSSLGEAGQSPGRASGSARDGQPAFGTSGGEGSPALDASLAATPAVPLTLEQARERAFHVVADPMSRVMRVRQLSALLPHITSENWRQVLDGFEVAMRTHAGGAGGENYNTLLEHIGAVAGAAALEDALSPEKVADRPRFITILKGWADADAKSCVAWYSAQTPEIQRQYLGHFVAGVGRTDPRTAMEFTFRPDSEFLGSGTAIAVINNAVSAVGVQGVEDLFLEMRGRDDIKPTAKRKFFGNLVNKQLAALGKSKDPSGEVLRWFGTHAGREYVGTAEAGRIVGEAAKTNAAATMGWLESNDSRLTPEQAGASYQNVAREFQKQTPQEFEQWLGAHPTHPQRDPMMEAATGALLQVRDYPGALKMARGIGDEATRNKVLTHVQNEIGQLEQDR